MGLTTGAAARVLGVSVDTVVNYSRQGILHAFRSSSGWRYFRQDEVENLAKARARKFGS
ncbi:MAG: helix-turn-helix domain-containing protein [Elusimicrobiota bacterium]